MPNMSYCRFVNTLGDLRDCEETLGEESFESLSDGEREACQELYRVCQRFVETYENDMTTPDYGKASE